MFNHQSLAPIFLGLSLSLTLISPGRSQINPNGAGTLVNPQGNQINIAGGTQAGANLFHSFQDFNLNSAQIANFLSNPQTQNILARINGGNPSVINGLLQVTGGNSNLFLMNPAGIIFGQGAILNVPANFTATTANQIGFDNNQYFSATGNNNYAALIGNPDSFLFTTTQAGSIVNTGILAVGNGQNLSLIAGNTINTGRLTAPGGEIQLLAVPGTNRVRLSQPGQVLSLEVVPPENNQLRAVDLPTLLTGSSGLTEMQLTPTGQVQVAGTALPNQQGLAVASGRIDVSSPTIDGGDGGVVQVLGDRVAVLNSRINANGATGGGIVRLGGEYLGGRDTAIAPSLRFNAQRTLVDRNSLISANATTTRNGGRVIVWADQNTGFFGRIAARGATGQGGFVEVSGKEHLAFDGQVNLSGFNGLGGTLLLDPANIAIIAGANNSQVDDAQVNVDATILNSDTPANMTISAGALASIAGADAINITATGNIDFQANVTLIANGTAPITFTASTITASLGAVTLDSRGRNIVLNGTNNINAQNLNIITSMIGANSGSIQSTANAGDLRLGSLGTSANSGDGGVITLNAPTGNITFGDIDSAVAGTGNGGGINVTAQGNIITSGYILSFGGFPGNGGAVTLNANQGIFVNGSIVSGGRGAGRTSGAIDITAGNLVRIGISGPESIFSSGAGGAGNGAVTIRHGGSTTTPFIVGNSATNGTTGIINAGAGNVINTTTTIPVSPDTYNQGIVRIITTAPLVVPVVVPSATSISPEILAQLRNPPAPPTPAPVIVGTPPESTPIAEVLTPSPDTTAPVFSPIVVVNPAFTPIPTPQIPTPQPVLPPMVVIPPNSPTPLPIARPGNLEPTSPRVQPVPSNTQNCVVRSPYQGGISWVLQIIRGQQVCARETVPGECCSPRTDE